MAKPQRVKPNQRQETVPQPQAVAVSRQWSGPLPPPEALARFNEIVPNGAERVFKMAEAEQAHRISSENTGLVASIAEAKRGQLLGASISIVSLVSAIISVYLGAHWVVTALLVGVPIMGLAKAIVDSRSQK
ncbi:MAG: DUF2335 domain-containing protein [Candidatus Nitrotoga sp.]